MKKSLEPVPGNVSVIKDEDNIQTLRWTSKASISVEEGSQIRVPRGYGGQIGRVTANVTAGNEPSGGSLEIDMLIEGSSVFESGYLTVRDGQAVSDTKLVDGRIYFSEDNLVSFEFITISSAAGPVVIQIEFLPGS